MLHKIIAISGNRNSGKDTAANMLLYLLNVPKVFRRYWIYKLFSNKTGSWKKVSFAQTIKSMLAILLKVSVDKFEDRSFKENTFVDFRDLKLYPKDTIDSSRILSDGKFNKGAKDLSIDLIRYNLSIRQLMQYWGTEISHKFFGKNVWINSTLRLINSHNLIVSDLRFRTEMEAIKKLHGITIYIDRIGCIVGNHVSEKEMFELKEEGKFDYIIDNNGDLKDLFNKCKIFASKIN